MNNLMRSLKLYAQNADSETTILLNCFRVNVKFTRCIDWYVHRTNMIRERTLQIGTPAANG